MRFDDAAGTVLANRCFLYRYLWRAFAAEPDDALLDIVADAHTREECALLDGEDGEGARLQDALAEVAAANGLGQLRSVYTKLFIGPAKLPAPPWESVYATGEPLLFQESTLAVREAYRRAGYAAAGYPHEADDHLAVELDFMATLASDARAAYEAGDKGRSADLLSVQRDFLREHLLAWVGAFAERLADSAGAGAFYPRFAELAALVCARDAEVLEELLAAG